jgi:hypothetical protein
MQPARRITMTGPTTHPLRLRRLWPALIVMLASGVAAQSNPHLYGGKNICFDENYEAIPCPPPPPPPPPPDGSGSSYNQPSGDYWHGGILCSNCHVNRTTEVTGPGRLNRQVMSDTRLFVQRHDALARRIADKSPFARTKDAETLPLEFRRLVDAFPRGSD